MTDPIAPPKDYAEPARTKRRRGRRLLWWRWYGLPPRAAAAWHARQIVKYLRLLLGLRDCGAKGL